jgi:hypothetical protein
VREKYCWLVAGGWFVLREKYCWLVADKPNEHAVDLPVRSAYGAYPREYSASYQINYANRLHAIVARNPLDLVMMSLTTHLASSNSIHRGLGFGSRVQFCDVAVVVGRVSSTDNRVSASAGQVSPP